MSQLSFRGRPSTKSHSYTVCLSFRDIAVGTRRSSTAFNALTPTSSTSFVIARTEGTAKQPFGSQTFLLALRQKVGVSAGVITAGIPGESDDVIAPIKTIAGGIFNVLENVRVQVHNWTGEGAVYARPCFTKGW